MHPTKPQENIDQDSTGETDTRTEPEPKNDLVTSLS